MKEKCFISSISSDGYVNLLGEQEFDNQKLYSVNYMPQENVDYLVNKYADAFSEKDLIVYLVHNPINLAVCGFIVEPLKVGFVNFFPFEEPFFKDNSVSGDSDVVAMNKLLTQAKVALKDALDTHNQWEQIYINATNFNAVNRIRDSLIMKIFYNKKENQQNGIKTNRFFGACSKDGSKDFIGENILNYKQRYYIKGRPGSGKSTLLTAFANAAMQKGYDVCCYHCAFDPKSLDMVTVKELSLCIFDSTPPHEYFPKNGESVIDIYETAVGRDFDDKNRKAISTVKKEYFTHISDAVDSIQKANSFLESFKQRYTKTFNDKKFKSIDAYISDVLKKI